MPSGDSWCASSLPNRWGPFENASCRCLEKFNSQGGIRHGSRRHEIPFVAVNKSAGSCRCHSRCAT